MSFYDLATECQQLARMDEATTMSSISYLPTQVGAVRAALKGLGKKKGQWNLEILEGDKETTVRFEDALEIKVPKNHWDHFQGIFDGVLSSSNYLELSTVGLLDSVDESENGLLEQRLQEIHSKIQEQVDSPAVQRANKVTAQWLAQFGGDTAIDESVLIPLPISSEWKDAFVDDLTEDCKDDLGQLEIVLKKLQNIKAVRECSFLAGGRAVCNYQGLQLVFEASTSWSGTNRFSIAIHDDEAADAVEEALMGVPRIGNVFYPRGGQMDQRLGSDSVLNIIKETIDDMTTEKE